MKLYPEQVHILLCNICLKNTIPMQIIFFSNTLQSEICCWTEHYSNQALTKILTQYSDAVHCRRCPDQLYIVVFNVHKKNINLMHISVIVPDRYLHFLPDNFHNNYIIIFIFLSHTFQNIMQLIWIFISPLSDSK